MIEQKLIVGIDDSPKKWYQRVLYGCQHLLAMFVANALISILVFTPYDVDMVASSLISAGVGTLVYLVLTKLRSPVFLASSAALMPVMSTCLALNTTDTVNTHGNFIALIIGMVVVGLVYVLIGLMIKFLGTQWLNKLLPPVIVGPIIMLIGLGLAGFAVNWSMYNRGDASLYNPDNYNLVGILVALFTMFVIAIISHYSKKTLKTLPFLVGILSVYALACALTGIGIATNVKDLQLVDLGLFRAENIEWLPTFAFMKAAEGAAANGFEWTQLGNILLVAIPVSLVAICEHIGDHLNLSNITGRELFKDPGLSRTLMGDGIATALGGPISGLGNTTYGENVAVIGVTKIGSSRVLIPAALLTIILGFFGPLMLFVKSIPYAVFGGASLILYGFIAMSGVKSLQKVDLTSNKNMIIVSVILIMGVGGLVLKFGSFTFTSTALAMIIGIILNAVLVEPKPKDIPLK